VSPCLALQAGVEGAHHGPVRDASAAHLRGAQVTHARAATALLGPRLSRRMAQQ